MTSPDEFMTASEFGFEHTTDFVRERAARVVDPYDPDSVVEDWSDPDVLEVSGYFASSSSVEQVDPVRAQVLTAKHLVIDDPGADVRRGDRIRRGTRVWTVEGFPSDDINPFTGWQPTLVVSVKEAQG